jgi:hypothetical protein
MRHSREPGTGADAEALQYLHVALDVSKGQLQGQDTTAAAAAAAAEGEKQKKLVFVAR